MGVEQASPALTALVAVPIQGAVAGVVSGGINFVEEETGGACWRSLSRNVLAAIVRSSNRVVDAPSLTS